MTNQENNNFGRDQNVINQPENVYVDSSVNYGSLPYVNELKPNKYLFNYVLTFLSLIGFLTTWIVLGLFAKSEFPVEYVWGLLIACLKGPKNLSETLDAEQKKVRGLSDTAFRARRNTKEENSRLNKLDSKIILLEEIIELLYKNMAKERSSVSEALKQLEDRKSRVLLDLEPLRQQYDPNFYKIKKISQVLSEEKLESEKGNEYVESTLNSLIEKYKVTTNPPSDDSVSALIRDLRETMVNNSESIRLLRLKPLGHTLDLLQWTFSLRNSSYTPKFSSSNPVSKNSNVYSSQTWVETEQHPSSFDTFYESPYDFPPDSNNSDGIDLKEVVERPYGEFINRPWLELINSQIEKLLRATTDISTEWINKVITAVSNEWVYRVSVYGFNQETKAEIELALNIDWDNQELNFQSKNKDQAVDIDEAISEFQRFVRQQESNAEWMLYCTQPENPGFKRLGFSNAPPVIWATHGKLSRVIVLGLPKLSIELNFGPSEH